MTATIATPNVQHNEYHVAVHEHRTQNASASTSDMDGDAPRLAPRPVFPQKRPPFSGCEMAKPTSFLPTAESMENTGSCMANLPPTVLYH